MKASFSFLFAVLRTPRPKLSNAGPIVSYAPFERMSRKCFERHFLHLAFPARCCERPVLSITRLPRSSEHHVRNLGSASCSLERCVRTLRPRRKGDATTVARNVPRNKAFATTGQTIRCVERGVRGTATGKRGWEQGVHLMFGWVERVT
jgi:hypothetical protein